MRFLVLSNDAFEEAAIIANLSKRGNTWVAVEKASASVTHIVVHPDVSSLSNEQRVELSALKKKCMADVIVSRDVCSFFGFQTDEDEFVRMAMAAFIAISTHEPTEAVLKHHHSVHDRKLGKVDSSDEEEEGTGNRGDEEKELDQAGKKGIDRDTSGSDGEMRDTELEMIEIVGAIQVTSNSRRIRSRRTRENGRRLRVTAHHDERCYDS
eukprot:CAMPEP_0171730930 /NCGR_PEP_ID=MMETSP0991-20121206/28608_1 /TAXON_ID=483369 /ORGANISM="non described non described, Strain CCMP2098" /LENGTH=209 /DNA_ID=CAMNT_0012325805 /DNA_START=98 /DNA_END=723 /DNA_ORIENTATION=+